MDWSDTRKLFQSLARGRRSVHNPAEESTGEFVGPSSNGHGAAPAHAPEAELSAPRAASLCIASGKGGTGKSVVTASLSALFSARGRTLIVDADLGVGNAHILQDVSPARSFVELVEGECNVREVLVRCSERCDLIAAGSGIPRMAALNDYEMHLIAEGIQELENEYRFMLVDSAAGVSKQTVAFARACDLTLMVTTPDLTAMTDAYAFVKVLMGKKPAPRPLLLVNRAHSQAEAQEVADRIRRVCQRYLGTTPKYIGWMPEDDHVIECVNRRGAVVVLEPYANSARALRKITVALLGELSKLHPAGMGHGLIDVVKYSCRK